MNHQSNAHALEDSRITQAAMLDHSSRPSWILYRVHLQGWGLRKGGGGDKRGTGGLGDFGGEGRSSLGGGESGQGTVGATGAQGRRM